MFEQFFFQAFCVPLLCPGVPYFHGHRATPASGAAMLQIYWRDAAAFESELELWQPQWCWCLQHRAVCGIPGCANRMILDGGWKLFRTQVCEVALPAKPLPIPTLQLNCSYQGSLQTAARRCYHSLCCSSCRAARGQ